MQVSKHHPRQRSATVDPFSDPSNVSYSAYGVPTLTRNAPRSSPRPPPPPPKQYPKPHSRPYANNIMDAVRDTVTVRGSTDQPTRTRVGRSQTELPAPTLARPAPPISKRSQSQDNMEKGKSSSRTKKKGSSHADVIDRLDFSGVGPMFHHDGPFDACAPSRNRHRTKAPMMAWSAGQEADERALANAQQIQPRSPDLFIPYEAPKKKYDAIAEAWGIHEPEPFEDFSAGGGATSQPSGEYARTHGNASTRRTKDGRDARDVYREYLEENHPSPARRPTKRNIPPPQPIFVPEGDLDNGPPSPPSGPETPSGNTPRRNKSIMQRIRKMRDSPNVPVANYDEDGWRREPSPGPSGETFGAPHDWSSQAHSPSRPTHRSQGSFLGRLGRAANYAQPTTPSDDAFVYVDHVPLKKNKSLPTPPKDGSPSGEYVDGYFDGAEVGASGSGLGRKTSLLKKVGTVVKGRAPK
ncbi:hypothetical protein L227DRAFT_294105 [Lentinus tigrinus ALCF2SS1-6]|uniref:Pal1-domain-containing protein n=1 Tax=Lentinus tigrinus ALCF2SS1-6 TaxID=1328759 RepID=A0A5C2RXP9_9APHY|nr:hypothetical protein L227DRAFT_294105 [Lentinus tigrinus ALCF2SS1-6]